jgi:hypothetical protein
LFALEPLAGKLTTPIFGGTAAVWSILLVFFQLALLIGYAFTYALSKLGTVPQSLLYIGCAIGTTLATCSAATLPWPPPDPAHPEWTLLCGLSSHFGASVIFLATVSGVMQVWFERLTDHNPYPLYSLSNFGSLAALVAYPFLIEPTLTMAISFYWWRVGLIITSLIICICALVNATAGSQLERPEFQAKPIRRGQCLWWITLSAIPSALLVSMTAFLTQDVAPVPLLWIPPLAVYLISYIVAFTGKADRIKLISPLVTLVAIVAYPIIDFGALRIPILWLVPICLVFLFAACMTCQDEVYRTRPEPANLPIFYLMLAIGGACGGLAAAVLSPLLINQYLEHCIIMAALLAIVYRIISTKDFGFVRQSIAASTVVTIAMVVSSCAVLGGFIAQYNGFHGQGTIYSERNFYGTVRLVDRKDHLELYHGSILHGLQFKDAARRLVAAPYYANVVDLMDQSLRGEFKRPISYGVVGLGVGTMCRWTRPGDRLTFYELDPKIDRIAHSRFTFLSSSKSTPNIVLGDARASLRSENPNNYDLLMVDAFNGDSIPMHLLTREAIDLYKHHIVKDGAILFHVSNHYLELLPVLANAAAQAGLKAYDVHEGLYRYVLMTNNDHLLSLITECRNNTPASTVVIDPALPNSRYPVWTDDYSNILSVLKFRP